MAQMIARIRRDAPQESKGAIVPGVNEHRAARQSPLAWCLMVRSNNSRTDRLHQLHLDRHRKSMQRWRIPGRVDEYEPALAASAPVVVWSAAIMAR
jgi:hypothetical protein